jgi:hypothetical protein
MVRFKFFLFLASAIYGPTAIAQGAFYSTDTVREIRIYFTESNWDQILDSFYVEGAGNRLLGSLSIDGTPLDSVGIRYKGYSSVSTNRLKNPFNIDLDYRISGQDYQGYDKIKLSNVIQDPSFLREVLSYEIARNYMPASKANFANVYINDTLWGLYTNVESVNKEFLSQHFYSNNNSFFKGNPESLDLSGENSNLSDSPGTDSASYYTLYDMKSDNGWSDLYRLIDTLNNHADSIEKLLNVDRTLWMHAFNYGLVNFDSYVGYAQNYYLYRGDNGRFNPILWDLNMSFASYRFTDASDYWSGFSISEASLMDPLAHYNSFSVYPRPLLRNLFATARYRRMYMAHIRTIMEENIVNSDYYTRGMELQALIDTAVQNDTNKFYGYADFQNNLTSTVSDLIDYPGLTQLMDARAIYMSSLLGYAGAPSIDTINPVSAFAVGGSLDVNVKITDATDAILAYRFDERDVFSKREMYDDGMHNDGMAGDSIYGATIQNVGNTIQYYFYAENDSAGKFSPVRAAYEYYTLEQQILPQELVINEFMASNTSTVTDQNGQYEDWIELYNNTTSAVSTGGLYLTDSLAILDKWPLPFAFIEPGAYFMIWADNDSDQPGNHANFKLATSGEFLALSYSDGSIVDSVSFATQYDDITTGRFPNGTGPFQNLYPTYGDTNRLTNPSNNTNPTLEIFPNPAKGVIYIQLEDAMIDPHVELISIRGQGLIIKELDPSINLHELDVSNLAEGIYMVNLRSANKSKTTKIIITK